MGNGNGTIMGCGEDDALLEGNKDMEWGTGSGGETWDGDGDGVCKVNGYQDEPHYQVTRSAAGVH